jgi:thiamine biosynthesis lipoprotein ApbE
MGTDLGADLTTVDALATAVYVMGVGGLPWLLEQHPELDGVVITRDDEVLCTPGIHRYLSRSAARS